MKNKKLISVFITVMVVFPILMIVFSVNAKNTKLVFDEIDHIHNIISITVIKDGKIIKSDNVHICQDSEEFSLLIPLIDKENIHGEFGTVWDKLCWLKQREILRSLNLPEIKTSWNDLLFFVNKVSIKKVTYKMPIINI